VSSLTELPNRDAAIALHAELVRASPRHLVTAETATAFAAVIGADADRLHAIWGLLGPWVLRELDRMVLHEGRVRRRRTMASHATAAGDGAGQVLDLKQTRSWYQKLPLWRRPVAIGNTGRRKQLSELTHGDCQTIAQFYMRSASTMQEKGDRWAAISRMLNRTETLGAAQGKLAPATLEFLRDETGGEVGQD